MRRSCAKAQDNNENSNKAKSSLPVGSYNMIQSQNRHYRLTRSLLGLTGPAWSIAVHPQGKYLAIGGESTARSFQIYSSPCVSSDRVHLWELTTGKEIPIPGASGIQGAVTAMTWMIRPDNPDEALAFGTNGGYMSVWRRKEGTDAVSGRIALRCRMAHNFSLRKLFPREWPQIGMSMRWGTR